MDWTHSDPLGVPELVEEIIRHVDDPPDLLNCACINRTWNWTVLRKLYRGSSNNMRYRTPNIAHLNRLLTISREHFARCMSFVEHLVLMPDMQEELQLGRHDNQFACVSRFLALDQRRDTMLLLPLGGKGPASLAIPFQFIHHDVSYLLELILHSRIDFLTINYVYCEPLVATLDWSTRSAKLSNLAALSIHGPRNEFPAVGLCEILQSCDLKLFSIQDPFFLDGLTRSSMKQVLQCLQKHKSLRALALMTRVWEIPFGEIPAALEEEKIKIWPELQVLYLESFDYSWLEWISKFENLQVLHLDLWSGPPGFTEEAVKVVAKCQLLRTLVVNFHKVEDPSILVNIAHGCPLLMRFSVHTLMNQELPERLTEGQLLQLMQALPHLEVLFMNFEIRMSSSTLRDLAKHHSQLKLLHLSHAQIFISRESLVDIPTLLNLQLVAVGEVFFAHPGHFTQLTDLRSLAGEWTRVFPRLRHPPCPADLVDNSYKDISSEWHRLYEDWASLNENGMIKRSTKIELGAPGSPWFELRKEIWKMLGYRTDLNAAHKFCHVWQTDFEIQTVGWPVLSIHTYMNPDSHSM